MTAAFAEIPTIEAAQQFANQAQRLPDLELLFKPLEDAGFPIGIEGRLRVWTTLSRLLAMGVRIDDAATLSKHLMPVLATSQLEQAEVTRLLRDWIAAARADQPVERKISVGAQAIPVKVRQLERADWTVWTLAVGLIGAAVIAVAVLIATRLYGGMSNDIGGAAADVVGYSQPVLDLGSGLDPFWKRVLEEGFSRLGFALVVLIAGLSFAAWRRDVKGRLVRKVGETDLVDVFGLKAAVPDWFRNIEGRIAFDRLKRIRWIDTSSIDVQGTIAKTVRAGGRPLIAFKRQRELPNYVLLVDRSAFSDHAGLFARVLEAALIDANIIYARYDYSGRLHRLNPVRGGAKTDIVDDEYLPFSVIASRHAGERMILVGAGTGFFESPGIRIDRAGRRTTVLPGTPTPELLHLREFSATFLVTPAPKDTWGENERRLQDLGLSIFPADLDGIENLAAELLRDPDSAAPALAPSDVKFLDRVERDSMRLMSDIPPRREEILHLVNDLKGWADDPDVFTLLAAIAAFPKIDAGFTLVLAGMILQSRNGKIDSSLYGRISRLPWVRAGRMPDWLRIGIINSLRRDQRNTVRAVQIAMLKQTESLQDGTDAAGLPQLIASFEAARELPEAKFAETVSRIPNPPLLSADERIFFSVLREQQLDPEHDVLRPEAPEAIQNRMEAPERRRRAQLRIAVVTVAALAALLQPWIWKALIWAWAPVAETNLLVLKVVNAIVQSAGDKASAFVSESAFFATVAFLSGTLSIWAYGVMRADAAKRFNASAGLKITLRAMALITLFLSACTMIGPPLGSARAPAPIWTAPLAAFAATVWIWVATPERWWNWLRADDLIELQLQRDGITASLGTLAIVAVWGIPWFQIAVPTLANSNASLSQVLYAMAFGAAGWVAVNSLMRCWLLGHATMFALNRVWLDFVYSLMVAACVAVVFRMFADVIGTAVVVLFSIVALLMAALGNLGADSNSVIWRPALRGMAVASLGALVALFILIFLAIDSDWRFAGNDASLSVSCSGAYLTAITLYAIDSTRVRRRFNLKRETPYFPAPVTLGLLFGGLLVGYGPLAFVALLIGEWPFTLAKLLQNFFSEYFPISDGTSNIAAAVFWAFCLPISLMFWPIFRFIGPMAVLAAERDNLAKNEPKRWWLTVTDSPWWGTLAMWLVSLRWMPGANAFSLWPLMLPIAAALTWRHGSRATAAIAVGTLPLLVAIAPDGWPATPGGLWPAIVILFWARFVSDTAFRENLLRRETLPWVEAIAIVVLMSAALIWPTEIQQVPVSLVIDPAWMTATVALVVGVSRMPLDRFVIALLLAWIASQGVVIQYVADGGRSIALAIDTRVAVTALLVLFAARGWRIYAAGGVALGPENNFPSPYDRSRTPAHYGIYLAFVIGGILGLYLGRVSVSSGSGSWPLAPTTAGALVLAGIGGLVIAAMLYDRVVVTWPVPLLNAVRQLPPAFQRVARFCLQPPIIFVALYGVLVGATPSAFPFWPELLGVNFAQSGAMFGIVGMPGFLVCFPLFMLFGAAVRLVSERRDDEKSWRQTARRLWTSRGSDLTVVRQAAKRDPGRASSQAAA